MLEKICRLSAYQFHNTLLGYPENVRMRSVDCCLPESIPVVFILIWLWVMAQKVFWAAGVGRHRVKLLYIIYTIIRIRLSDACPFRHMTYVAEEYFGGTFWYSSRNFPHFVSCLLVSYCNFGSTRYYQSVVIGVKFWLIIFTLPCSGV